MKVSYILNALFFCLFLMLSSCDGNNDYKFYGSEYARYDIFNKSTQSYDQTNIVVDVYYRKGSDGNYYYAVENEDRIRYDATAPMIIPIGYTHYVPDFRFKDKIGMLYFKP